MEINIIAAVGKNNELGFKNDLPWPRINEDLQYFKKVTTGSVVIMGRATWESLGKKALPNRSNIIITSKAKAFSQGFKLGTGMSLTDLVTVEVSTPMGAIMKATMLGANKVFIIGGASIYKQFLDMADKIYLTVIDSDFEADVFFPEYNVDDWEEVSSDTYFTLEHSITNLVLRSIKKNTNGDNKARPNRRVGDKDNSKRSDRGETNSVSGESSFYITPQRPIKSRPYQRGY